MRNHAHIRAHLSAAALSLAVFTLAGCGGGDGLPRQEVSGRVTLNNKPLPTGIITFTPSGSDSSTQGGSIITDGNYLIPKDTGLVPGTYKVTVSSGDDTPEKKVDNTNNMPGMPPIPAKESIPSQFNSASTLTAEVKAGGPNKFEFNLTALPGKSR